ncbi:hypothetical protein SDC9_85107 [bioreactor metagenome]|uniref:Uncharacterized protein n=1 Tax=bioreactor metagenome TaxID=1076179 RepID=A0A644ZDU1_9ZZZZ
MTSIVFFKLFSNFDLFKLPIMVQLRTLMSVLMCKHNEYLNKTKISTQTLYFSLMYSATLYNSGCNDAFDIPKHES